MFHIVTSLFFSFALFISEIRSWQRRCRHAQSEPVFFYYQFYIAHIHPLGIIAWHSMVVVPCQTWVKPRWTKTRHPHPANPANGGRTKLATWDMHNLSHAMFRLLFWPELYCVGSDIFFSHSHQGFFLREIFSATVLEISSQWGVFSWLAFGGVLGLATVNRC